MAAPLPRFAPCLAVAGLFLAPAPALAELPDPVRAMIDAAIATGDKAKVATVIDIARQTNPDDAAEIDALHDAFLAERKEAEALAKAEAEEELRQAGLFDNWSGKGEVGAFRSTGNNSNTGLSGAVELARKGIDWSHQLRLRADYQRSNGATTRERYFAAYEPRFQIDKGFFAYGLGQFEADRFQGYDARYALSAGIGYRIIDESDLTLSAKLGPAYRLTQFTNGTDEGRIAALAGLDFDWTITDRVKLTQDGNVTSETGGSATAVVDSSNVSLNLLTGLQLKVSDKVSTRLSYQVDYESNPPAGTENTDTMSRFTLIYGF